MHALEPEPVSSVLDRCLADPGYTPPVAALAELVRALELVDEGREKDVRRSLARAGAPALDAALTALAEASPVLRERLLALLGTLAEPAGSQRLLEPLLAALSDPMPRCRRAAARALGKLGDSRAEPALLAALERSAPAEQRAVLDALGKLGGEAARAALESFHADDPDVLRRAQNARVLLERRAGREETAGLRLETALGLRARVVARCRAGLGGVLRDEAASTFRVTASSEAWVELEHEGSLAELLRLRTALDFGVVVPLDDRMADPAERIARALEGPLVRSVLQAWSEGAPRVRLELTQTGPRRALVWSVARRLLAGGVIRNDPRGAVFSAELDPGAGERLLLVPRLAPDPRFAYRVADVPAASHPTIAAALARFAGVRADDVVWDPFVGSGLELVERARLGPYARLVGSDLQPSALKAAAANVHAAGVERLELVQADARTYRPAGVRLIITNPPMGRRVARDGSLRGLLEAFVEHAAGVLPVGGRLVWLSPLDRLTARLGSRHGLSVVEGPSVDLGGFSARVQALARERPRRT